MMHKGNLQDSGIFAEHGGETYAGRLWRFNCNACTGALFTGGENKRKCRVRLAVERRVLSRDSCWQPRDGPWLPNKC